jgi:branched-chain amino acid transport system permease protein
LQNVSKSQDHHQSLQKPSLYAILGITVLILGALFAPFIAGHCAGHYGVRVLDFALLAVILAFGLNVIVGFAGLLNLGYIAFYAIGAYTAALLSSPHLALQFSWAQAYFPLASHIHPVAASIVVILLAMAAATLVGVLLGAPTLRLRGDYLALVTLGFGEIVRICINNLDRPLNLTNGPQGISDIAPLFLPSGSLAQEHSFFGLTLSPAQQYYYVFLACAVCVAWICQRLQHSRLGRAWAAIREDEVAAQAMGIQTHRVKLLAFALGAAFGGLAGALFAAFQQFVSPESFTFWESIVVLACVVLGGMGHIRGVVLGALLLFLFPEFLRLTIGPLQVMLFGSELLGVDVIRQLLYGLAMIIIMLYRPMGLWPAHGNKQTHH